MPDASLAEIVRAMTTDPEYRQTLTARISARTLEQSVLDQLIAYARSRQTTLGHALARKVLTDAGVSWEAL
jgi:hypothetical protein